MLSLVGLGLLIMPLEETVVTHRPLRPSGPTRSMLLPLSVILKPGLSRLHPDPIYAGWGSQNARWRGRAPADGAGAGARDPRSSHHGPARPATGRPLRTPRGPDEPARVVGPADRRRRDRAGDLRRDPPARGIGSNAPPRRCRPRRRALLLSSFSGRRSRLCKGPARTRRATNTGRQDAVLFNRCPSYRISLTTLGFRHTS